MRPIALQMRTLGPVWWNATNTRATGVRSFFSDFCVNIWPTKKISEAIGSWKDGSKSQEPRCIVLELQGPSFTLLSGLGLHQGRLPLQHLKNWPLSHDWCLKMWAQKTKVGRSRQTNLARGFICPWRRWMRQVQVFVDREQQGQFARDWKIRESNE